ncbi:DHA2 family efflux MFS transporter permease subunit [Paenibacillus sp. GP183]|uniref:DHA2 family efflux MFS transporter permease subunit n=1 Tax=Paenibacillus sp. GP183 TaxID=1882751 RepID=UPI00089861B5|nr:DHA2 family efflux MFS transporter permease subunit [Paenibacillus sp. GP183]SEB88422.1 drug resistance transporter, EmrB/QacA subfamily [Paenibacillus sp. GP183]
MSTPNSSQSTSQSEFSIKSILAPLVAVILGMIMVILDSTIVNVAVPNLQKYFSSSLKIIQWTITGYTLALSAVIPLAGWMTDKFGAKRIFLITIALFTLGSVLCALAQTPEQLILFRVIQGIGGGMVSPIGIAMVYKLAPENKRGSVMGMLGIPMLLAPVIGPVLSGWLIEVATWHWIFLINLPIGIVALLVGFKFLPNLERQRTPALDIFGMILAPVAFAMLAFGVSEGGTDWGSTRTLTGLIVGGLALLLFIIVELLQKQPLLELRVFRSSDFTRSIIITWIAQTALFGSILMIPLYLQNVRGFTPLESGLTTLPMEICAVLFMPIGGRLFDKWGVRPIALTGLSLISISVFSLSQIGLDTPIALVMVPIGLLGAGMGFCMMTLNTHVLNSAPKRLVSRVTPLTSATQQVVMSFSIAGLTGYFASRVNYGSTEVGVEGNMLNTLSHAFGNTFLLIASIVAAGTVLSIILRKPKVNHNDNQDEDMPDPAMMMNH